MKVRWLGWAGVEIEADGAAVVIDPLADPGATFAALGERARSRSSCRPWWRPRRGAPPWPGWSATSIATTPTPARSPRPWRMTRRSTSPPGRAAATSRTSRWLRPTLSSSGGPAPKGGRGLGELRGRAVHADRAARRRRARRSAGLLAGRGRRAADPPPRRHDLPRLLVADGPAPRSVRRRLRADQRGRGRLPSPAAAEPAGGGDGAGAGRGRRRLPRRGDPDSDALRRLRDRSLVRAGRRVAIARFEAASADRAYETRVLELGESFEPAALQSAR